MPILNIDINSNMLSKNDITRGVTLGLLGLALVSILFIGFSTKAYSADQPTNILIDQNLNNFKLPSFRSMQDISTVLPTDIKIYNSSFNFTQFFGLDKLFNLVNSQGGIHGVVVLVINIFLTVLAVVEKVLKLVLDLIR